MKSARSLFSGMAAALAACLVAQAAWAQVPEFAGLAAKVGPAVVNISVESTVKAPRLQGDAPGFPPGSGGSPFDDFFGQFFGQPAPRKEQSLGSGFLIAADGYILTNNHVVEGADKILVKIEQAAKAYPAKIVGQDADTDLALIKINAQGLPFLSLGDSSKMRVGDWVLAFGNPFGLDHTVTKGIISAKGRVIGAGPYDDFLQTDAAINPGNSGGPLVNMDGEVIGINAAILASGQGIGFAIPSNMAKEIVPQLKAGKKVRRGLLGVSVQDLSDNMAKALGLKDTKGALVAQVAPNGPAGKAGVQAGDVITQINGDAVADARDLTIRIGGMAPGDTVRLTVVRKGAVMQLAAVLEERNAKTLSQSEAGQGEDLLGMTLKTLTPGQSRALGAPAGKGLLVAAVDPDSPADEAGVQRGDVILQMNQTPVNSLDAAQKLLDDAKARGALLLLLVRHGQQMIGAIALN
jgi:serine protease Do